MRVVRRWYDGPDQPITVDAAIRCGKQTIASGPADATNVGPSLCQTGALPSAPLDDPVNRPIEIQHKFFRARSFGETWPTSSRLKSTLVTTALTMQRAPPRTTR